MSQYSIIDRQQKAEKIPDILREHLQSEKNNEVFHDIMEKHNISGVQKREAAALVADAVLGLLSIDSLKQALINDAGIQEGLAGSVLSDLKKEYFAPIQKQLSAMRVEALEKMPQGKEFAYQLGSEKSISLTKKVEDDRTENNEGESQRAPEKMPGLRTFAIDQLQATHKEQPHKTKVRLSDEKKKSSGTQISKMKISTDEKKSSQADGSRDASSDDSTTDPYREPIEEQEDNTSRG